MSGEQSTTKIVLSLLGKQNCPGSSARAMS